MRWQMTSVVVPVHDSLECACLVRGDHCVEATRYNVDFWYEYWMNGVPEAMKAIDTLKSSTPAAAASPAASPAVSFLSLTADFTAAQASWSEKLAQLTQRIEILEGDASPGPTSPE